MAAVHAVLCAARAAGRGDERLAGGGRRRGGDYGGDGGDGGARELLRRADFGALGCVLFEMLSGFGPWDALPSLVGTPRRGANLKRGSQPADAAEAAEAAARARAAERAKL